jgi:hypothetical protein
LLLSGNVKDMWRKYAKNLSLGKNPQKYIPSNPLSPISTSVMPSLLISHSPTSPSLISLLLVNLIIIALTNKAAFRKDR